MFFINVHNIQRLKKLKYNIKLKKVMYDHSLINVKKYICILHTKNTCPTTTLWWCESLN